MFSMIERAGLWGFVRREGVPLVIALVIAELFYKLGSFSLECVAFLATWYLLSGAQRLLQSRWSSSG